MKLLINPLVVTDLKEIRDYISEDNPDAALRTINEIYKGFETLQQFPNIGADLAKRVTFKTDYKYFVHGNYITIYRVKKEQVEIYRVIGGYQDITGILFR
jgi:toxin ParE1/3/4